MQACLRIGSVKHVHDAQAAGLLIFSRVHRQSCMAVCMHHSLVAAEGDIKASTGPDLRTVWPLLH